MGKITWNYGISENNSIKEQIVSKTWKIRQKDFRENYNLIKLIWEGIVYLHGPLLDKLNE